MTLTKINQNYYRELQDESDEVDGPPEGGWIPMTDEQREADKDRQRRRTNRLRRAAMRLNSERAKKGIGFSKYRKQVRFTPCPKASVYIAAAYGAGYRPDALAELKDIGTWSVFSEIWNRVVETPCECHPDLTVNDLLDYEFEPSAQ